ncbi:protein max-like [Babylonia areolata]|uniref:protein max-like n=1 Tax=Babylonia areolata TaxID=304850 RepID=UPI003FD692C8
MSDEDRDVDIESDEEEEQEDQEAAAQLNTPLDKRAHHNALERKRRDHIKDSFHNLRDSVPTVHGEKVSRAQILKKAADYIQLLREKNTTHQKDIDSMRKANQHIQTQIKLLEKYNETSQFSARTRQQAKMQGPGQPLSESSEEDDAAAAAGQPVRKKMKATADS